MHKGSSARFLVDSTKYLKRVKEVNKGFSFFDLRDRLLNQVLQNYLIICHTMPQLTSALHHSATEMLKRMKKQGHLKKDAKGGTGTVGMRSQNFLVTDLSGRPLSVEYQVQADYSLPQLPDYLLRITELELRELGRGKRRYEDTDFGSILFKSYAVGIPEAKTGNNNARFVFSINTAYPNGIIRQAADLLSKHSDPFSLIVDQLRSDCTHELIHLLDPRRRRKIKSYDLTDPRAYTRHIVERASKINDAFGELVVQFKDEIAKGNRGNFATHKKRFLKNKLMYVDYYIKENVGAPWPSSVYSREKYAPELYAYAIKSMDRFFASADWGKVHLVLNALRPTMEKIKRLEGFNRFYQEKFKFESNPGYYIMNILSGTGFVKMSGSFPPHILSNPDIFDVFFKELTEIFK